MKIKDEELLNFLYYLADKAEDCYKDEVYKAIHEFMEEHHNS